MSMDNLETAWEKIARLEKQLALAIEANPFANTRPSTTASTGISLVDRLRGIYRMQITDGYGPIDGKDYVEQRYAVGKLSHEAADALEESMADTARLDWWFECNEKERGHVMALVHMKGLSKRDAIDQVMNATKGAK